MPTNKKRQKKHFTDPALQNNSNSHYKSFDNLLSDDSPNKNNRSNQKSLSNHKNTRMIDKSEMEKFVIWRHPIMTTYYFIIELIKIIFDYFFKILKYRKTVVSSLLLIGLIVMSFNIEGAHLPILLYLRTKIVWCGYWCGLGIASSIGLGTGLHTFLLYLGPFIAQVTLAAYECNSLNFPEPPYPEKVSCPINGTSTDDAQNYAGTATMALASSVSILSIMSKVRLESFMWGAGTAIGELPPYFMARASALSSKEDQDDQDEELMEFENLMEIEKKGLQSLSLSDQMRLVVFKCIKKVGFFGILLCASIPNPLFDLAGITCGHFLVKFSTFFGATLIGKAIIKMHIQQLFIIFLFSQHYLDSVFLLLQKIPYVGESLQPLLHNWLNKEKQKFRSGGSPGSESSESILSWILGKIVLLMILFFVVSIVNSLAQRRYKRLNSQNKVAND